MEGTSATKLLRLKSKLNNKVKLPIEDSIPPKSLFPSKPNARIL